MGLITRLVMHLANHQALAWVTLVVAAFGVFFAIGSIAVGWLLWCQSQDFKKQHADALAAATQAFDDLRAKQDAEFAAVKAAIVQWHESVEARVQAVLDNAPSGHSGQVDQLQALRDELDRMKPFIEAFRRNDQRAVPSDSSVPAWFAIWDKGVAR